MVSRKLSTLCLVSALSLATGSWAFAQSGGSGSSGGGAGGASGSGMGGGAATGGAMSPGAVGSGGAPGAAQQPSGSPNANNATGGALTPPIVPPGTTGSVGAPGTTNSGNVRQGPGASGSAGDQTGLGNIGPQTERERRAQDESDRATKGICSTC
jgi:hypothetical protein